MINRIKWIMDHYSLSAAQFADKIGVQRSVVSHVLSGRNKPSLDFMLKIKNRFNEINLDWLLMGTGNPRNVSEDDSAGSPIIEFPEEQEALPEKEMASTTPAEQPVKKPQESTKKEASNEKQEEVVTASNQRGRKLQRVILFYSDGGFESYEN